MRLVFGWLGVLAAFAFQSVGAAAQTPALLIAESLKAAGLPAADVQVIGSDARRGNLVARLRGRGTREPVNP